MIRTIYFIILAYFILGVIGFYFINRKKEPETARSSWIKYITYFIIIHVLFFSIVLTPMLFRVIAAVIVAGGFYEMYKIYRKSEKIRTKFYVSAVVIYILLAAGFFVFSGYNTRLVLFTFLILSIFDSFSQIIGQIWGRRKLFRKISPQKTIEGFIGGVIVAVASSYWLGDLLAESLFIPMRLATGIIAFAFLGDMIASMYKRNFNVKDYSTLIPGHGGFLDRFDSLIAGGAFVTFNTLVMSLM